MYLPNHQDDTKIKETTWCHCGDGLYNVIDNLIHHIHHIHHIHDEGKTKISDHLAAVVTSGVIHIRMQFQSVDKILSLS